ncbi:hypothetical protein [Wolbachia endosymbiont (group A) of Andrena helvola]|uniref:hypothetical protein n=1 Tax=Wolbachia endosymbiont (group A) of Andrena helvola TaxID=3066192 RepID=UPI00333F958E
MVTSNDLSCHSSLESSLSRTPSKMLCFNIRLATFMLTNLVPIKIPGSQCLGTGMTSFLAEITLISQQLHSLNCFSYSSVFATSNICYS